MHNKELNDFYILAGIFRVIKLRSMSLAEDIACTGEMRNVKGRPRIGWEDDIKMVLKDMGVMWAGDISLRIKSRSRL
jgi:hypothetical protein